MLCPTAHMHRSADSETALQFPPAAAVLKYQMESHPIPVFHPLPAYKLRFSRHSGRRRAELDEKSRNVQKASDFSEWRHGDMSELFWMHLGKYIKEPNEHSISLMFMVFRWACHDNQGLANSFRNALKWAKIDLYTEQEKWIEKRRNKT